MMPELSSNAPILAVDLGKFSSTCCFFKADSSNTVSLTVSSIRTARDPEGCPLIGMGGRGLIATVSNDVNLRLTKSLAFSLP